MSEREIGNVTSQSGSSETVLLERLGEAGCLACECGMLKEAEQIYACLVKIRPSSSGAHIGLAIARSMQGQAAVAAEDMRKVLIEHPESDMVKAVLGMILAELKDPEAEALFQQVLASGKNQDAVNIVQLCMQNRDPNEQKEIKPAAPPAATTPESLEVFRHRNIRP